MQTEHLNVTGMSCGGCTRKVTSALTGLIGVSDVKVSLATGEATVQYDEQLTSPGILKSAIKDAGYGVDAIKAGQSKGSCCS